LQRFSGRGVGSHQLHDASAEVAVHDLVGVRAVHALVAEGHDVEVAAEDGLVEGHRVAGVAVEVQVGVQLVGHEASSVVSIVV
jgi:hypothetical protein